MYTPLCTVKWRVSKATGIAADTSVLPCGQTETHCWQLGTASMLHCSNNSLDAEDQIMPAVVGVSEAQLCEQSCSPHGRPLIVAGDSSAWP